MDNQQILMKPEYEKYLSHYYTRNTTCKHLRGHIALGRKDSHAILECRSINKYDDFDLCPISHHCQTRLTSSTL